MALGLRSADLLGGLAPSAASSGLVQRQRAQSIDGTGRIVGHRPRLTSLALRCRDAATPRWSKLRLRNQRGRRLLRLEVGLALFHLLLL